MVGIVIVVTNEKYNLGNFFNSLKEQTFKDFKLYFVDNNSSDGSLGFFKDLNEDNSIKTEYITFEKNYGFSEGSNKGVEYAIKDNCNYIFIANNDLVLEQNCLKELYTLLENEDTVCAGPLLLKHSLKNPDTIQEFGGKVNFRTGNLKKYFENKKINETTLPEIMETDFVGGGICFIRAEIFKNVGMFETAYFGYFDEIDLAYRLKIQNGYKILVTSKAIAWHNHYSYNKNKNSYYFEYYLSERNKFLYFYKYRLYFSIFLAVFMDLLKFPVRLIWFIKVCDFKLGLYYLKGMADGLLKKKGRPAFSS